MQILIVGCGYLGFRAAQNWLAQGHRVSALTRNAERAAEWQSLGIEPIIGDVMDPESLRKLPDADVCLYAVGFDRTGSYDKRQVYVDGVSHVLREIHRRVPRLLFISSTSVYGQTQGERVDEQSECAPATESGKICLEAEGVVSRFYSADEETRSAVLLRLAGIYGPKRLIGRIEQLRSCQPIAASPEGWLNLIHVDDAIQVVTKLLTPSTADSSVYVVSDGHPIRRRDFYSYLANRWGTPEPCFAALDQSLNKQCDNGLLLRELNLKLLYPTAAAGLEQAIHEQASSVTS